MDIILNSVHAILPLYIIGGLGYFFNKIRGFGEKTIAQINSFVFDVLYPIQFFYSIYTGGLSNNFSIAFLIMISGGSVISFIVSYLISVRITREKRKQGVLHQAFFRGNMLVFGLAITNSIFDASQQAFYLVAMAPILLIQNIGMMLGISMFDDSEEKFSFMKAVRKSVLSPQIIAILIGVFFVKLHIPVPRMMINTMGDLSSIATPLCLILIGAGLKIDGLNHEERNLLIQSVIIKLLVLPVIAILIIFAMNLELVEAFVALLMFATPPSLTTCVIALQKKWDIHFASAMLFYTTCLSLFTLTLWIFVLQQIV